MSKYYYRRQRRGYYRRRRSSSFKSAVRTGGRIARFGGRTIGRVGFGVLRFGTKVASHILVAGVSTAGRIVRAASRS